EGQPLDQFDFTKDDKQTKLIARQMMRMVAEINRRLDTLPGRAAGDPVVTCRTCHRGVSQPVPLQTIVLAADSAAGVDSAMRAYRNLRTRYYGRDAYDFGEQSLSGVAFGLARAGKIQDALALVGLNEEFNPASSGIAALRGNLLAMKGDTNAAALAYREAIRRDSTNQEARRALQQLGRTP
ncbi:MAG TPA: photosynthetic reaction center cytochrome c subunit family protein, partial [Gemmatimonadales bacterium]|nr:photosynthetic reaction center cytochrome c subunit family protein [Gemmatimonadales bacterium]